MGNKYYVCEQQTLILTIEAFRKILRFVGTTIYYYYYFLLLLFEVFKLINYNFFIYTL